MSLQVNLSGRDISEAYQNVVAGRGIDWALFTYEKGSNDLKVQSTGNGGLEELIEEFSDGRIQYAFAKVTDPNTQLPKFVQINWCGDGVPEVKKGLFHTHSSSIARFLRGTHVVISARNEADIAPSLIMRRVEMASGSKYSAHKETARKFEPIAPVGTNYRPIGQPDIASMRNLPQAHNPSVSSPPPSNPRPPVSASTQKPAVPSAPRPGPVSTRIPFRTAAAARAPADAWEDAPVSSPPPLPAASRPPTIPSAPRSTTSSYTSTPRAVAPVVSSNVPTKPAEEDRIEPVGTAYTPIKLTPGKLRNPFESRVQEAQATPTTNVLTGGPKKLTWSERQALAKKQADDEGQRSQAASFKPPTSIVSPARFGARSGAAVGAAASVLATEPEPEVAAMFPPPPPASPPRTLPQAVPVSEPEPEPEDEAPPSPPPPPMPPSAPEVEEEEVPPPPPPPVAAMAALSIEPEPEPAPPPPPPPPATQGFSAVVLYDYEATEDNEINLVEGETISQIEEVDDGWWHGVGAGGKNGLFPANYVEAILQPEEQDEPQDAPPPPPPPPPVPAAPALPEAVDEGVVATALYAYTACEDNEISFEEGDRITQIEEVGEGWWQGHNLNGEVGMFPANYVELVE